MRIRDALKRIRSKEYLRPRHRYAIKFFSVPFAVLRLNGNTMTQEAAAALIQHTNTNSFFPADKEAEYHLCKTSHILFVQSGATATHFCEAIAHWGSATKYDDSKKPRWEAPVVPLALTLTTTPSTASIVSTTTTTAPTTTTSIVSTTTSAPGVSESSSSSSPSGVHPAPAPLALVFAPPQERAAKKAADLATKKATCELNKLLVESNLRNGAANWLDMKTNTDGVLIFAEIDAAPPMACAPRERGIVARKLYEWTEEKSKTYARLPLLTPCWTLINTVLGGGAMPIDIYLTSAILNQLCSSGPTGRSAQPSSVRLYNKTEVLGALLHIAEICLRLQNCPPHSVECLLLRLLVENNVFTKYNGRRIYANEKAVAQPCPRCKGCPNPWWL